MFTGFLCPLTPLKFSWKPKEAMPPLHENQPQASKSHLLEMDLTGCVATCGAPDMLSRIFSPNGMVSQSSQGWGSWATCLPPPLHLLSLQSDGWLLSFWGPRHRSRAGLCFCIRRFSPYAKPKLLPSTACPRA